jgi:RNA polymerase-interacting CarD/CdnL/TRCF family regulator
MDHVYSIELCLENGQFGDGAQDFYAIGLSRGGKLLLPVDNVTRAGIRPLVSASKARELIDKVRQAPDTPWITSARERAASFARGLRSGSPDRYTAILQELLFRARSATLSSGDQHALDVARGYFVGEVGAALDRSAEEVAGSLDCTEESER